MTKVRRFLMHAVAKPGFLASYIAQAEQDGKSAVDKNALVNELTNQLGSVGIAQEDAFQAFAA